VFSRGNGWQAKASVPKLSCGMSPKLEKEIQELVVGMTIAFRIEITIRRTANLLESRENTSTILHVVRHNAMDARYIPARNCNTQSGMRCEMGCADKEGSAERQTSEFQFVELLAFMP
jgi:hypothetical protein